MGSREKAIPKKGPGGSTVDGAAVRTVGADAVADPDGLGPAGKSVAAPGASEQVTDPAPDEVTAVVNGSPVRELYVLLRHAAFHVSDGHGTHEMTRIFVTGGTARAGDRRDNKVGPARIRHVELDLVTGLKVKTDRGTIWAPAGDCQATWVES